MKDTYIPLKDAYICPAPDCQLIRLGPGPCACGQQNTVYIGLGPMRDVADVADRREKLSQAAVRTLVRGRVELNKRLPETFCRTCAEKLDCVENVPPVRCPLGLKDPRSAA